MRVKQDKQHWRAVVENARWKKKERSTKPRRTRSGFKGSPQEAHVVRGMVLPPNLIGPCSLLAQTVSFAGVSRDDLSAKDGAVLQACLFRPRLMLNAVPARPSEGPSRLCLLIPALSFLSPERFARDGVAGQQESKAVPSLCLHVMDATRPQCMSKSRKNHAAIGLTFGFRQPREIELRFPPTANGKTFAPAFFQRGQR
jgi:hypothetical protein